MKKLTTLLALILIVFCLAACEEPTPQYNTTPDGFLLDSGIQCTINGFLTYEVISYDGELTSVIDEAEELVRQWWNDDSTFQRPTIVWCTIIEGNVRGFQDDGYLFLDPDTTHDDLLATTVHEWLHDLVDKYTLISNQGTGHQVMEMVVEAITVDILEGVAEVTPTDNYLYFEAHEELWSHKEALIVAFRQQKDFSVYREILGENYMLILMQVAQELA